MMTLARTFNMTDQDCLALAVLDDISRMLKSAIDAKAGMMQPGLSSGSHAIGMRTLAYLRLGNRMKRDPRLRPCSSSTS